MLRETLVAGVALALCGTLLPATTARAETTPAVAPAVAPAAPASAAAAQKSSDCRVTSSIAFKGTRKKYFKVTSGYVCGSGYRGLTVSSDFVLGGFFVELRKKCSHTSSCKVSSAWLKNPKGKRKYYNAVLGGRKKHWYSIVRYTGHRFTHYF